MRQVGMVERPRGTSPPAWRLLQQIQKWKEHGLRPADIDVAAGDVVGRNARALYPEYQRRLLERGMLDYTDLTLGVLRLFSTRPDVLQHYRRRFRHVLVDELQARPPGAPRARRTAHLAHRSPGAPRARRTDLPVRTLCRARSFPARRVALLRGALPTATSSSPRIRALLHGCYMAVTRRLHGGYMAAT